MKKSKPLKTLPKTDDHEAPFGPTQIQKAKVKKTFTEPELLDLGSQLSNTHQQIEEIEEEKKNATAEFSNRIKILKAQAGSAANKIRSGYEMQDVEVRVEFYPKRKVKKLYTLASEFIREDPMTWEDMQLDLPIAGQDPGLPNPVIPTEAE